MEIGTLIRNGKQYSGAFDNSAEKTAPQITTGTSLTLTTVAGIIKIDKIIGNTIKKSDGTLVSSGESKSLRLVSTPDGSNLQTVVLSLNNPLRRVNDVYDYFDISGEHQNISLLPLNVGSWTYGDSVFSYSLTITPRSGGTPSASDLPMVTGYTVVDSDTFESETTDKVACLKASTLYVRDSDYTDADTFKTAMADHYIYYAAASETLIAITDEQIEALYSLKSYDGTTKLGTLAETASPTLTVEYAKSFVVAAALEKDVIEGNLSQINSNLTDNYYTKTEVDSKGINYVDNNFGSITLTANQEKTLSFTLEDATKEIIGYNVICGDGNNAWIGQSVYGMIVNGNSATIRMINVVTASVSGTLIIRFFYR